MVKRLSLCVSFKEGEGVFQKLPSFSVFLKIELNPTPFRSPFTGMIILLRPLRIHSAGLGCNWGCGWAGRNVDNWKKLGSEDGILECMLGRPPTVSMERREPDLI